MRAHLRGRDVAGIDRRIAGGQHRQQRRLRPLEMEGRLEFVIDADVGNVVVPPLARVFTELVLRFAQYQVEGAFHVIGGERLAVVPFDALPQLEGERGARLVPSPAGCQLRLNVVHAVLWLVLIVVDQIIEHRHHRNIHREGRLLVNRQAGRCLAMLNPQDAAVFRLCRLSGGVCHRRKNDRRQREKLCRHCTLPRVRGCQSQWP